MRRIPRTKGAISGFLIVLLGLWGALIPFVGPYFDYAMHSDQTWQWFSDRFWLEVLPGVVTVIGGLILLRGATRASNSLGAMIALAGGLWYIAGPTVSMLWNDGAITIGPPIGAHNLTRTLEWLGFHYALGGLITLFSAYALGFMAALPIVDERIVGRTVATGAAAGAAGAVAGRATAPRREPAPAADAPTERVPAGTAATRTDAPADTRTGAAADTATAPADAPTEADRPETDRPRSRTGRFFRRRRATTRT
ncbi:MAG TPA: hypothetical protein VH817_07100 [Thermoleophilaceae bacterium]|jgi:hypothetical protein